MDLIFSRRNRIYIYAFLFCLFSFAVMFLPESISRPMTTEDGPFETAGALFFLGSSVLFFMLFLKENKFADIGDRQFFSTKGKRTWFLLLAMLFFILMGEEVSWGQRIFGWGGFEGNVQGESTLHNLPFWNQHLSEPGAVVEVEKTGIAAMFTAKKIFVYIFLSFLFLLPLAVKFVPFIKNLVKRLYIPVPAIELGILFILNIILFKAFKPLRHGWDGAGRGLSEIEEFNFAFILFLVPFVWLMNKKGNLKLNYTK
ncbi:MAG: hypothetical protein ACI8YQ_001880 [Polaribacter sp.]|jgi:hypothetical protein